MGKERRYFQLYRPEMVEFLPMDYEKVLEIGCGEGCFAKNLKSNCEIWGVEMDEEAANVASSRFTRVLHGKFMDVYAELPDEYFDLVICNDVIEHMEDHELFFKIIKPKMKNGHFLIGSIPNVRNWVNLYELLLKKDWKYTDEGILDRTHLRFFTQKSLKRYIHKHGFEIVKFKGINRSWRPLPIIVLTLGYYTDIQYLQFAFCLRKKNIEKN